MAAVANGDNRRQHARRILDAAMLLRIGKDEFLARVRDLSDGGFGFVVKGAPVRVGEAVEAGVLLDGGFKSLRGVVRHMVPAAHEGTRVGVGFGEVARAVEAAAPPRSESWDGPREVGETGAVVDRVAAGAGRRSSRRRKVRLSAHVEPGRHPGVVEDISETGAFVWSPLLLTPGQNLRLSVRFSGEIRNLSAVVKWTQRARGVGTFSTRTGMGVCFSEPLEGLGRLLAA